MIRYSGPPQKDMPDGAPACAVCGQVAPVWEGDLALCAACLESKHKSAACPDWCPLCTWLERRA